MVSPAFTRQIFVEKDYCVKCFTKHSIKHKNSFCSQAVGGLTRIKGCAPSHDYTLAHCSEGPGTLGANTSINPNLQTHRYSKVFFFKD